MGISAYIKEIGRGKDGARALTRAQAADLMGQLLDGQVSDLEIGHSRAQYQNRVVRRSEW